MINMTNTEYIRARLLAWVDCGPAPVIWSDYEILKKTQWSRQFEQLMRNRMLLGCGRYGWINQPGKPQYCRIQSVKDRLEKYNVTGNTEYLVDCANLLMLEFEEGIHPLKHFRALDEDEQKHVQENKIEHIRSGYTDRT
jgi:hypothetical protein